MQANKRVFHLHLSLLLLGLLTLPTHARQLSYFHMGHYNVYTNAPRNRANFFARHMNRIFDEYQRRFKNADFSVRTNKEMALYLLTTRQDYLNLLRQNNINATNSGGMFVVTPKLSGLFIFTRGRPIGETLTVMQHEGFHQFAFRFIGPNLPIWVNEGIAQYFEDGILVGKRFHLNIANSRRVQSVQHLIRQKTYLPFEQMLQMSDRQWSRNVQQSASHAAIQYDQAWSMIYFLINGSPRYRNALTDYLRAVGKGESSQKAFINAFAQGGSSFDTLTAAFQRAWIRYSLKLKPNPLSEAVEHLTFLAYGMLAIRKQGITLPTNTQALETMLKKAGFYLTRTAPGGSFQQTYRASNASLFQYRPGGKSPAYFQMLPPANRGKMPRLTAPGLKPFPTLIWYRDSDKKLYYDITYR